MYSIYKNNYIKYISILLILTLVLSSCNVVKREGTATDTEKPGETPSGTGTITTGTGTEEIAGTGKEINGTGTITTDTGKTDTIITDTGKTDTGTEEKLIQQVTGKPGEIPSSETGIPGAGTTTTGGPMIGETGIPDEIGKHNITENLNITTPNTTATNTEGIATPLSDKGKTSFFSNKKVVITVVVAAVVVVTAGVAVAVYCFWKWKNKVRNTPPLLLSFRGLESSQRTEEEKHKIREYMKEQYEKHLRKKAERGEKGKNNMYDDGSLKEILGTVGKVMYGDCTENQKRKELEQLPNNPQQFGYLELLVIQGNLNNIYNE
jgi:hypothetical protein